MEELDNLIFYRTINHQQKLTRTQIAKYEKLSKKQKPTFNNNSLPRNKLVVNLSSHSLSDTACSVLSKGLEFGVTPAKLPTEEIITGVEAAIQSLPTDKAEEIRHETVRILKKNKSLKQNLSKKEILNLKELKENENIVVLPADKGKATVILNKSDYVSKANIFVRYCRNLA